VCGARVWFFRNERGGCAYFDAIGVPWPKHPCMDRPGRYDPVAGQQARQAYERAQSKAAKRARRTALADDRQRQGAARKAAGAAHQGRAPRFTASAPVVRARKRPIAGEGKQRSLGWWTVFAMLLAWFGSLPLTVAMYADPEGSPMWTTHLIVGMPTVVSLVALLRFLFAVPTPKPTFARILGAVLLAPLFLVIGVLVFLFTAGFGSLVFAWILRQQARRQPQERP
jgi:hypothetical protein